MPMEWTFRILLEVHCGPLLAEYIRRLSLLQNVDTLPVCEAP